MATPPAFLDSNVFFYAVGADHPQRAACQSILEAVADGELSAVTSTEVVQELLYVLDRRGRREDGLALARHVIALMPRMLAVTSDDMLGAVELLASYPALTVRDAVHAATMQRAGLHRIISGDRHFDAVEGIERVDPASFG